VEQIEDQTKDLCHYAGKECTRYLANVYACAQPWAQGADGFSDSVMAVVARVGKKMALDGAKIGSPALHRFDNGRGAKRIVRCDPELYPPKVKEVELVSDSTPDGKFHPLYLFPFVVVVLVVGLAFYARKIRKNRHSPQLDDVRVDGTEDIL